MKYFIDTEFIEGTQIHWHSETMPTIDLISIAIVAEDGRTYYAISNEFNLREAWNRFDLIHPSEDKSATYVGYPPDARHKDYWIRDNVLKPIFEECCQTLMMAGAADKPKFTYRNMKWFIKQFGIPNAKIANDITRFVYYETAGEIGVNSGENLIPKDIQFYGYFADYDWVVFCWLFGKMIDLPKGFPMYCRDLKQMFDEAMEGNDIYLSPWKDGHIDAELSEKYEKVREEFCKMKDPKERSKLIRNLDCYPKQTNEHNALSDAIFCRDLYLFLSM